MSITEKSDSPRPAIPHDPLPQAGESLRDELMDRVFGRAGFWLATAVFIVAFTSGEWTRYFTQTLPTLTSSIVCSIFALIFVLFATFKIAHHWSEAKAVKLGLRGELHVAQYLEQFCRPLGYQVFHDIPASGSDGNFNIDHVLIGPAGIFSLETKNWTKPPSSKGTATITVDGNTLNRSDGSFDNKAIPQTHNNADYIRDLLARLSAKRADSIPVHPVLMLPGWYITFKGPKPRSIWVLADRSLHTYLPQEPQRLSPLEIAQLCDILATYTRNKNAT